LHFTHLPQLVQSTVDVEQRIQQWIHFKSEARKLKTLHARPEMQTSFVEAGTDTEKKLVAIWQDVLGIELIGTRDNFFELGGDSMLLVQVHKAVREQASTDVAVAHLFQFPSIGELAAFIDKNSEIVSAESIVSKRINRRRARDGNAIPEKAPV
jgi:acyl carrier protein